MIGARKCMNAISTDMYTYPCQEVTVYECSRCQTLHFVISTSAALSYDLDPTHKEI